MQSEELEKWLEAGPNEVIDCYDLIHSPEFKKVMEDEPWDEYEKEDFQ
jgi:hypothetical protein